MTGKWKARMHTHKRVGDKMKEFRLKSGVSQSYLAKCVGCAPSAISNIERGVCGSMELMEGYLWALGYDISDLKVGQSTDLISIQRGQRQRDRIAELLMFPHQQQQHGRRRAA